MGSLDVSSLDASPAVVDALLSRTSKHIIKSLAGRWRKPVENEVYSAAAFFYRKFFAKNTPAHYCPEKVLLACFNLACKTEESHTVTLKDLVAEDFPLSAEEAVDLEVALFQATEFEISVEQPWPIILYYSQRIHDRGKTEQAQLFFNNACDTVGGWQWTDAVLVFSFAQLAVAGCLKASSDVGVHETVAELILETVGSVEDVEALVVRIQEVAFRHEKPDVAEIEEFSRRCRIVRDGEKVEKRSRKSSVGK